MLKLLSILSYFLKELIFDSQDEYDVTSSNFNMRKVALFAFLIFSITMNLFLMNRTVMLASNIVELKKSQELKTPVLGKNPELAPSDSGITPEKLPQKSDSGKK